ncbi:hypothetical protein SAMN05660324_1104 [Klenkia brasiliensis]|uniref:Uncharacterized protein n=1 Tax=Klenkia brasiliensis TaxID=333142 RepID=A0A1G7PIE3_9ACTN|nr:hypothetical protein SAMN05660324_1104 [Klenkia brasiliensis]
MSGWWVVWGVGLVLPVVAVLFEIRSGPSRRRRTGSRGEATPTAYALSIPALLCLLVSARNLSVSTGGYGLLSLGGALISLIAVYAVNGWHNRRLPTAPVGGGS